MSETTVATVANRRELPLTSGNTATVAVRPTVARPTRPTRDRRGPEQAIHPNRDGRDGRDGLFTLLTLTPSNAPQLRSVTKGTRQ